MSIPALQTYDERNNNFGLIRIILAAFVIFAHSPELIDGNNSRELLSVIFGSKMSLGELGVYGFFLVSGYLITKSFIRRDTVKSYFLKRILRIVPGYITCFWLCILFVTPFVIATPSNFSWQTIGHQLLLSLLLLPPLVPGAFHGLPFPELNGSMWTIAYEFRCYLATALIGLLGGYGSPRRRALVAAGVLICLLMMAAGFTSDDRMLGSHTLTVSVNLTAAYGVGALYYLYREKYELNNIGALIAATLLIILLFTPLGEVSYIILGGYIIFWFALKVHVLSASRLANNVDISYGLYLYAWPVQSLIIWNFRNVDPLLLSVLTLAAAGILAYASWVLIESPALNLLRRKTFRVPLSKAVIEAS